MAEYGAHITITSRDRPSIFDVIAQDSLMSTLQPAVKHAFRVLAENNPARYGWCLLYHSELFLLFNLIIQHHYLANYGASFAENFYDLKRVNLKSARKLKPLSLSRRSHIRSLMTLVGFPYLHASFERVFLQLREMEGDDTLPKRGWKPVLQRFFLRLWPHVHFVWESLILIFYLRYMLGKSKFHSPLLLFCGVRLATRNEEDFQIIDERAEAMLAFRNIRNIPQLGHWGMERIGSLLTNSLEVTAFFLQFLDWFYSSGSTPRSIMSKPIPSPPQESDVKKLKSLKSGDCPICCKTRKQDTVLSVSGYVFCYSCILLYVKRERKCPVTGYPAASTQLIRIYLDA
ncbi:ubiquitin-protein ligase peroxin 12 [Halocaridina rubra]|uniref:Peroxisome assembly protein 12 n=1 Tax=Halocaridina rubra TaxID=373956 RepID=A0AAN8ZSR1_HALRR